MKISLITLKKPGKPQCVKAIMDGVYVHAEKKDALIVCDSVSNNLWLIFTQGDANVTSLANIRSPKLISISNASDKIVIFSQVEASLTLFDLNFIEKKLSLVVSAVMKLCNVPSRLLSIALTDEQSVLTISADGEVSLFDVRLQGRFI